jgi:hypothetical protein
MRFNMHIAGQDRVFNPALDDAARPTYTVAHICAVYYFFHDDHPGFRILLRIPFAYLMTLMVVST